MTLPPLRLASATACGRRYPAIVGLVRGKRREIFICGEHIDRFLRRFCDDELAGIASVRIDAHNATL